MKINYYGFKAIYLHEMNRFRRTLGQSLLWPVISTSLYFVVFGSVIGGYIQNIDGVSYGSYIVPGLLMLTLLTQSISNTSFGIFFPKFNGTINEILAAPLSTLEIVLAFVGAGATKTLIVGAVIFLTASFFVDVTVKYPLLMIFLLILVSFTFALFGFLIGVASSNFEQMSIIPSLVITPMVFLGGSLYSLDMLPPFWQTISYFNPVVYLINGLRFSFYGASDFNIWISIGSMVSFLIVCVILVGPKELPVVIKTIKSVLLNLKGLSREFTKTVEEVTEFSEIKDIKKEILDTKDIITKEGKELDDFIDKNNKDILELDKND